MPLDRHALCDLVRLSFRAAWARVVRRQRTVMLARVSLAPLTARVSAAGYSAEVQAPARRAEWMPQPVLEQMPLRELRAVFQAPVLRAESA